MNAEVIYPWHRRWLPLPASTGVYEPPYQLDYAVYANLLQWQPGRDSGLAGYSLSDLTEQHRCVVLLGEPGTGKSREWQQQQAALATQPYQLFLDLGTISSEEVLRQELHCHPQVQAWQNTSASVLTLWLDSLDEGLLHIAVLQHALLRTLRPLPLHRLCLRIFCRNAVWPLGFSAALAALFSLDKASKPAAFLTLLLSSLTYAQVAAAAERHGFDSGQFMAAVAAADAQPLASRPVTLAMLLRLFAHHRPHLGAEGSQHRTGLYQAGCLELCERPDRRRPGAGRPDARQRLVLAGYVALLTVLGNRRVILAEPADEPLTPAELDLYLLGGGPTAAWSGHRATIDAASLRDLLQNTGLFTNIGAGRLVWAHQSYAEFLAGWYLSLTPLAPAALRPLFRSAADPSGGLVPALRETAAWLADLQPTFWSELLTLDPLALLQSDLHRLGNGQREQVVARLLAWFATLAQLPYRSSAFASRLNHPTLDRQLLPVLTDPDAPGTVARLATDLAIACRPPALAPPLLAQALDNTAPYELRLRALYVLEAVAQDHERVALRPLRKALPEPDEHGTFLRQLIAILWPTYLTLDELLPLLHRQQRHRTSGQFHDLFAPTRPDPPVPTAASTLRSLRWFTRRLHEPGFAAEESYFAQALKLVWQRGWELFEEPGVRPALAGLFRAATKRHLALPIAARAEWRVEFFNELLRHPKRSAHWHLVANSRLKPGEELLTPHDWEALAQRLRTRQSAGARTWLTQLLVRLLQNSKDVLLPPQRTAYLDILWQAATYPSVAAILAEQYCPLEEDQTWRHEHARQERERHLTKVFHRNRTLHELAGRRHLIRDLLNRGPVLSFSNRHHLWELIGTEAVKGGTQTLHHIVRAAGWARLSERQRQQAADIACAVLQAYPVPPDEWYRPYPHLTYSATDAHRAALICQHLRPAFLRAQPPGFWRAWAELLVRLQFWGGPGLGFELVQQAAAVAPDLVDQAILLEARARYAPGHVSGFYELPGWYQALPGADFPRQLLAALQAGEFTGEAAGRLLVHLLQANYRPAWDYAAQLLPDSVAPAPLSPETQQQVLAAYRWLLFPSESDRPAPVDWWAWWQRLLSQPQVATALLDGVMRHHSPHGLSQFAHLTETQLEALIVWLSDTYQLSEAAVSDWAERTLAGRVASFRTKLATELATRGSHPAWATLQRLTATLGTPWWLRSRLDQVRENLRRNAWEPPQPQVLATLSREADRRWLRSAADLQDVVLESLDRFQQDLHGELATAQVLWVPERDPAHRSRITGQEVREENFFSDRLRQHLYQDLGRSNLLIKREVEIRPSHGTGTGQRPDLYVEAFSRQATGEKITVATLLIEVKLSRNEEAETGLPTQLGGYLADQAYKHGIFVVGYHFGQYDGRPARRLDRRGLAAHLQAAAARLRPDYAIATRVLDIRLPGDTGRQVD